jgi:hypothetical protein
MIAIDSTVTNNEGVVAVSPFVAADPSWDVSTRMPFDPMHTIENGFAKAVVMRFWMAEKHRGKPYHIADKAASIDSVIDRICLPEGYQKLRPFELRSRWKGAEWRTWLYFVSLPALRGILATEPYEHWREFVAICFVLTRPHTPASRDALQSRAEQWVSKAQEIYGLDIMDLKQHMFCHAVATTAEWGPWYTFWAYPLESLLGQQVRRITTKKHANVLCNLMWVTEFSRWAHGAKPKLRDNIKLQHNPCLDELGVPPARLRMPCMCPVEVLTKARVVGGTITSSLRSSDTSFVSTALGEIPWSAYARLHLPNPAGHPHYQAPVLLHSQRYKREVATDSSFICYHATLQAPSNRVVPCFGSCQFFVQLEAVPPRDPPRLFAVVDSWAIEHEDWHRHHLLSRLPYGPSIPVVKKGGRVLVPLDSVRRRVAFAQTSADGDKGDVSPDHYDAAFSDPS